MLYSVRTKVLNKKYFFRDCQFCQNSEHCKLSMVIFTLIINAFYKTELSPINEHKTDKCPISIRFIAKSGYNLSCKLKRSIESWSKAGEKSDKMQDSRVRLPFDQEIIQNLTLRTIWFDRLRLVLVHYLCQSGMPQRNPGVSFWIEVEHFGRKIYRSIWRNL